MTRIKRINTDKISEDPLNPCHPRAIKKYTYEYTYKKRKSDHSNR